MASLDRVFTFALAIWLATSIHTLPAQEPAVLMEVEFCDFRVPDSGAQANATFTMVFSAVRGSDGAPRNVKKVRGAFLDDAPFLACIKGWRSPGPADERVVIEFDWVHAKGWTAIGILGKSSSLKLRIAPGVCSPYRRSSGKD